MTTTPPSPGETRRQYRTRMTLNAPAPRDPWANDRDVQRFHARERQAAVARVARGW